MKAKKKIVILLASIMMLTCFTVNVGAAEKSKTKSLKFVYHDSIIKNWNVGTIKGTFLYTYDTKTKKLVNKKSITYSTYDIAIGSGFYDVSKQWDWYDTKKKNGNGYGVVEWRYGTGIKTSWIEIGSFQNGWMAVQPNGDGTNTYYFC